MNRKIILIAIVIVAIAVTGVFLSRSKNSPLTQQSDIKNGETMKAETENEKTTTLRELMKTAGSQKCTYDLQGSSGTYFVKDGKMRTEMKMTINGKTEVSYMVMDGKDAFMWYENKSDGYKYSLEAFLNTKAPEQKTDKQVDLDQNLPVKCEKWNGDDSAFTPPTNINFQDLNNIMGGAINNNGNNSASGTVETGTSLEAMCQRLQEPAKSACLKAIPAQ